MSKDLARKPSLFSSYPQKGWKLSTAKKVHSRVDHTGLVILHNQAVWDLPQHLHVQFVM